MTVLALLMVAGLALIGGRYVVRRLGWPTEPRKALGLGFLVLVVALALSATAVRNGTGPDGGAASSSLSGDVVLAIPMLVLAGVGYRWLSVRLEGQVPPRPMRERRRALPPPPPPPPPPAGDAPPPADGPADGAPLAG